MIREKGNHRKEHSRNSPPISEFRLSPYSQCRNTLWRGNGGHNGRGNGDASPTNRRSEHILQGIFLNRNQELEKIVESLRIHNIQVDTQCPIVLLRPITPSCECYLLQTLRTHLAQHAKHRINCFEVALRQGRLELRDVLLRFPSDHSPSPRRTAERRGNQNLHLISYDKPYQTGACLSRAARRRS